MDDERDLIQNMVVKELRAICETCVHAPRCTYRRTSTKAVIQCELYEAGYESNIRNSVPPKGLCRSCDNAHGCKLPGRIEGVWHCNQFE